MTKTCSKCGKNKNTSEFPRKGRSKDGLYAQCKVCKRKADNLRQGTPNGKAIQKRTSRKYHLKQRYGMTEQQYLEMFRQQNGKCAICGVSHLELNQALAIDHNHATEQVRGLLCSQCNSVLGYARDNPIILDKARQYLEYYANKKRSQLEILQ